MVWPKPLQKPHPQMMIVGTSPETLRIAAERDYWAMVSGFGGPGERPKRRDRASRPAAPRPDRPADQWELGAQTMCLVTDSDEAARESMKYPRWQNRAGRALNRLDVTDGRVNPIPYDGEADDEGFWNALFYGNPDRVREKYLDLAVCGRDVRQLLDDAGWHRAREADALDTPHGPGSAAGRARGAAPYGLRR